jgi:glycerol-3-phosphate dehydrogenase (NAD+)
MVQAMGCMRTCTLPALPQVINETHENPRYLPGVHLGSNVIAEPDLATAVSGADLIIICAPHQFLHG